MLSAGPKPEYLITRFFAQEPVVERRTRVPVWRLQRLLDEWRSAADLVIVRIDRVSAGLFLSPHYLALPQWISSWMKVPEDLQIYGRTNASARADIRRIRIKKFECHFSRETKDFDLFYEKFYQPYISARHGGLAVITPRWMLRHTFRQGGILWVNRAGERVAGMLVTVKGRQFASHVNGVLDARVDLMQDGALSALYVHAVLEARRRGCTEINMGGSLPSLHDGVLRYKSKWAEALHLSGGFVGANCVTLLGWNRMAGPVAEFLGRTSLIRHDEDGFAALWAFPHDQPLTAETLQQHYNQLKTRGLRRFDILLPGEVPAGFVCPREVRLIPWGAVNLNGPELLAACSPGETETPPQSP
ncbi:MAG: hypothetical protein JWR15_4684 [Prosthecobacter sp.]|nr:hypothetical protein [Prosthecobacter sp.]